MSRQYWSETISVSTNSGTAVANTTTETILFPNVVIPANYLQDSRTLRLKAWGQISNVVTLQPTITLSLRYGGVSGTVLCKTAAITTTSSVKIGDIWETEIMLTVRGNGATGSLSAIGSAFFGNQAAETAANSRAQWNGMGSAGALVPASVTVDLTADTALSLTALWGAANAANSIQGINYSLESLN